MTEDGKDLTHKAGQCHLGATVGSDDLVTAYLDEKVAYWAEQVIKLANIAITEAHVAYVGFVFGLQCRWSFLE